MPEKDLYSRLKQRTEQKCNNNMKKETKWKLLAIPTTEMHEKIEKEQKKWVSSPFQLQKYIKTWKIEWNYPPTALQSRKYSKVKVTRKALVQFISTAKLPAIPLIWAGKT